MSSSCRGRERRPVHPQSLGGDETVFDVAELQLESLLAGEVGDAKSGSVRLASSTRATRLRDVFLGDDLLEWMVLALGGAMFAGNFAAVVRPRPKHVDGELAQAPVIRSLAMAALGLVAAIWALASLLVG